MDGRKIKCVIWDLDDTLWNGILTEDRHVRLRPEILQIIKALDSRGILQSVCSKNDFDPAYGKLEEFGISEYFLYPQISWNRKSDGVKQIVESINIGYDAVAFVDDQEFERAEVNSEHPDVMCIDSWDLSGFLNMDAMNPRFITEDSSRRRLLYQTDIKRNQVETSFTGPKEEFLKALNMKLSIKPAREEDLKRAEELTVRTHQLNSTGDAYSYDELKEMIESDDHEVLIIQLDDIYGTYGKIGLALVEKKPGAWELKLLLMSCRVMSRGIGGAVLSYIVNMAVLNGAELFARFVQNDRNRIMYITYKFGGFVEVEEKSGYSLFKADLSKPRALPDYIEFLED